MKLTSQLRQRLRPGQCLFVPGCYNALSARILEMAGFETLYMSGYGTTLSLLGMPDVGLATMTEMHLNARCIANAVAVPVIADADTGYGNAINVMRCVREYIQTGVAGIHIEDQVSPKRCGHVAGRQVIPMQEACGRIRAADTARRELDPDFLLIARSDARGALGGSLDEAITRANAYLEAGADMAFVEGPAEVAEVQRIAAEVHGPLLYNQTGMSPRFTQDELDELGFAIAIAPGAALRATMLAVHDMAVEMRDAGPLAEKLFAERHRGHPMLDFHTVAGFNRIMELEREFLGEEELAKYSETIGHQPRID